MNQSTVNQATAIAQAQQEAQRARQGQVKKNSQISDFTNVKQMFFHVKLCRLQLWRVMKTECTSNLCSQDIRSPDYL